MVKRRKTKTSSRARLPLVSVVIPCFNQEPWIAECIESALHQTYPRIEIIVVDDGSTDRSAEIIESYGKKIRSIHQARQGANSARNLGRARSKGKYIQFLDGDDYILPRKIENQVLQLENTGADLSISAWRNRFPKGSPREFGPIETNHPREDFLCWLLQGNWFAPVAALWRNSALDQVGEWDAAFPTCQDTDFNYRAAARGLNLVAHPQLGGVYRRHSDSSVSHHPRRAYYHVQVVLKLITLLEKNGRLADYAEEIASQLRTLSKGTLGEEPELFQLANSHADELSPNAPPHAPVSYQLLFRLLGMRSAERVASLKRTVFGPRRK